MNDNNILSEFMSLELAMEFLDDMPVCFSYWNENLDVLFCNKAYIELFDLESSEDYIKLYRKLTPEFQPNGQSSVVLGRQYVQVAMEQGVCKFEWTHQNLNGKPIPTEVTLKRVDNNGERHIACYVKDMRDVFTSKSEAKSSNEHLQFMLDTMPLATQTWSKDLKLIDCSAETVRLFGLKDEQEVIDRFVELSDEYQPNGGKSLDLIEKTLTEAFENGFAHIKWLHRNLEGEPIQCDVSLVRAMLHDEVVVIVYIVDERMYYEHEDKLRKAEEYQKMLLDASPFGTLAWNEEGTLVGANEAIGKMFGLEDAQGFIDNFWDLIPENQPDGTNSIAKFKDTLGVCFREGSVNVYWVGQDLAGNLIPTEVICVRLIHNDKPVVAGYIKDLREIEDSRRQMKAAEEFSQAILDGIPLGISIRDSSFQYIDCNDAMVELFGFDSKQDYAKNERKTMPKFQPDGTDSFELSRKKLIEVWEKGTSNFEVMASKKNGDPLPVELTLMRSNVKGQDVFINYVRDLTEVKASIKKIQDAERRMQAIIDAAPLCVNLFDENGKLVVCNTAGWKLFGFNSSQEYIDNFEKLFPEFQPDGTLSVDLVRNSVNKAMKTGYAYLEEVYNRSIFGEFIPCEVILKRAEFSGKNMVVTYVRDLRDINAALEEAHTATKAAEKSAQAKSEFLANMSHEIRTPMNGILGLLHILSHTSLNDSQRGYLEKTVLSANNLLRIIDDILDFSKIEAGKLEIEYIPFTLKEVCEEMKTLFAAKVEEKNITLTLNEGDFSDKTIIGDPVRLKQVLLNLIGNAIKFTHQGGVTLNIWALERKDGELQCTFTVKDTGIGLSKEQITNLFSAFSQADTSVTRKYGGTGLGLIISKRIVEMMNGKIWVTSNQGEGSNFYFTATFRVPSEKELAAINIEQNEDVHEERAKRDAHLLLVEDNDINQIIAEELLTSVGYTIDIAQNGQEALDMLDEKHYDLVLMDIQMPVMDGLTAATKIREQAKFASLPVIAMSAHAMTGDKEISLKHGMNDHITKPISPAILYNSLDYWLSKRVVR